MVKEDQRHAIARRQTDEILCRRLLDRAQLFTKSWSWRMTTVYSSLVSVEYPTTSVKKMCATTLAT
ncbi:MAG: hypothetical protein ABI883_06385 [Chthoniobacterales bacterium]